MINKHPPSSPPSPSPSPSSSSASECTTIMLMRRRSKMKHTTLDSCESSPPPSSSSACSSSSPSCWSTRLCDTFMLAAVIGLFLLVQSAATVDVSARRSAFAPNFSLSPPTKHRARIQYKTTYACEHRELHLDCEPHESIHLVRANYGRFSLSICNEGGRVDLSVMCMSYRSFLIMTDRCGNKSNCSVVVSSKLFGDPCPGTAKYLEVQYHCVRGGGASLPSSSSSSSESSRSRPPVQLSIPLLGNTSHHHFPSGSIGASTPASVPVREDETNSNNNDRATNTVAILNAVDRIDWNETSDSHQPGSFQLSEEQHNSTQVSLSSLPSASSSNSLDVVDPQQPQQPATLNVDFYPEPSDYIASYCQHIFMRSLFWNYTKKGEVSVLKCPGGASGFVRWQCVYNPETETAEWFPARPNFSECKSLWLDNLEERLNNDDSVIRIANEMATMTLTKALFADDLRRISSLIERLLAHSISSMQSLQTVEVWHRHQLLKELLQFIVEIVSNILGNAQDDAWLDLAVSMRKEIASSLIKSLESSALLLAENTNHDGSTAIAKPNVLVSVHVLDTRMPISLQFPTYEDTAATNEWVRMQDSIFLPSQSLVEHAQDGLAKVAFFAFYRIEDLLKTNNPVDVDGYNGAVPFIHGNNNSSTQTMTINSRVVGASISRNGQVQHYNLALPVAIVLRHIQEDNISSSKCVYWDMQQQSWLSNGCWVQSSNVTHTVCMCNHLTHFALVSEFHTTPATKLACKFESMIVLTSCLIASLVLAFIVILIMATPSGNTVSLSIHRNLCLTLLITEVTYLLQIYGLENKTLSLLSITTLHYFFLSTFCWIFFESFDIYMNVNSIYENFKSSRRLCWYYVFAYVCPLLLVSLCYVMDQFSYRNFALTIFKTDSSYLYILFIGPAIGLVLGGFVFILFASFLARNHSVTTTTIKCLEDFRVGCSKSLIRWVLCLIIVQMVNWSLAFIYITMLDSIMLALLLSLVNLLSVFYILIFCIMKIENIQHSCLFRYLPFALCQEDSQLSSAKNSTTSDVYSTRPVVTQVSSTQVNGMTLGSPLAHSPSTPTATSPVSMSPCLPPQSHPLPISQSIPWNYPAELARQCTTTHDPQSILAQQEHRNIHLFSYGAHMNATKTLPRELNLIYRQDAREDIASAAYNNKKKNKKRDFNFEFTSLHRNAGNNVPKRALQHRANENKYSLQDNGQLGITGAPNPDHIYESIDSESMASNFYDYNRRMNMLNYYGGNPAGVGGGGASNYRSKSTINEDDLSSSSIYEDKPLLFSNNSFMVNNDKLRRVGIAQAQHYHSNASIYDRNQRQQQQLAIGNAQQPSLWPMAKDSSELPDLVQKQNIANNVIVSYSGDNKKFFNKVVNPCNK